MTATDNITAREAKEQILAILKRMPTQNLPRFRDKEGCIWFRNLSMGWISSSDPERLAAGQIGILFAAESAGRELARRAQATAPAVSA